MNKKISKRSRKAGRKQPAVKLLLHGGPSFHQERVITAVQSYCPSTTNFSVGGSGSYAVTNNLGYFIGPGGTATDAFFSLQFSLSDLPQASSWSALYDAYRIKAARLRMMPEANVLPLASNLGAATTAVAKAQNLHTAFDYDDAVVPTSLNQIMEYESFEVTRSTDDLDRDLSPRVATAVYDGVSTGYSQPGGPIWLDMAKQDIPHYGIKGAIVSSGTTQNIQNIWNVYVTLVIELKQIR
jgi:hypothetical protein